MASKAVTLVEELIKKLPEDYNLTLWDAEYSKEGRDWYLKVFIDRTDGEYVSTDDCEKVSEFLSEELDKADLIEQNYYLMVSSPGMDRELKKPEHFKASIGEEVEVKLFAPLDCKAKVESDDNETEELDLKEFKIKELTGELVSYDEETGMVGLRFTLDTKQKNRKPGAKVSPKAIKTCNIELTSDAISKINLAVIFE